MLILTAITVGASYINFGSGNVVIALAIATVKAILVGLFFMHLLHDKPVNAVIAVAGFMFLGIFLMFDFIDVDSRTNPQPTNLHAPHGRRSRAPAAPTRPAAGPGRKNSRRGPVPEPLHPAEVRVLGALLEKEMTTPEYYPLTVNALVNACNQKSNREPVVNYTEEVVQQALGPAAPQRLRCPHQRLRPPRRKIRPPARRKTKPGPP